MFIASVLAFLTGIYIEAVHPFPFFPILIFLCVLVVLIPFLLSGNRARLTSYVLVAAFLLAGMFRVALVLLNQPLYPVDAAPSIYRGTVVESSGNSKVVELDTPSGVAGSRALIRSDQPADIGDRLAIFGSLREAAPTFKNPHHISRRWIKRLEGTFYEIRRGEIVSLQPGNKLINSWRRYLAGKIDASTAPQAGVLKALTLGDTAGIADETRTLFLETGTSHILSISGSHLGVVTGFFFFLARFAFRRHHRMRQNGDDRRYAALLTIPFAVLFMFTAGSGVPTIRATIMIVIYMLALSFERGRHTVNALFLSALAILVIFPHSIFTPSFQLTFISVLFIILVSRIIHSPLSKIHRLVRWPVSLMIVTVTATLGTLPAVLYHFHGFNPLSVLHNLMAVPLMCFLSTPLALCGLIVPFGEHLLQLSGAIVGVTITILDKLNWGYIYPIVRPNLAEALLYLIAALSLLFIRTRLVRFGFFALILPLVVIAAGLACQKRFHNDDLCVSYIDVGLGDAILIEGPRGLRLLIDGGGFHGSDFDTGKMVVAPLLLAKKITTLDYVVNTHPHEDHLAGLRHILRYFRVNAFAAGRNIAEGSQSQGVEDVLRERNIPSLRLAGGDVLRVPFGPDIEVLGPLADSIISDLNDASVVLKMTLGTRSFLFTGDIGEGVEKALIFSEASLKSSVLKVPHHGSRYSSTPHFIRAVDPEVAVLSVGPGIRGIPSADTIARYASLPVPLYRTDRDGCITICTDGNKLTVEKNEIGDR